MELIVAKRPDWDEYFLKLAMLASERATCPRMHCGCVIVKDKNVIATGYNGSIPGDDHCDDVGCMVIDNHCVRTNHAEMNALIQAAKQGNAVDGAIAYVTNMPCTTCAKALIGAGIKRVVIFSGYHDTLAKDFFAKAGVELLKIAMPSKEIEYDIEGYSSAKK
ncbi:MAG: cytidine/deoxycytidylate deaminase family protein [Candidatus Omnitrophica bacterium]|nr:cytidine/deoxycytidylate deaminase family protein [Candidatus Omnitrophota bacterium]MBU1996857.1 cytidine/deoxycytidylate deaminase family protein [Candidatus Omnitrophota bacterium]MBU4334472.1 cytidine/deoxycytidylate deaminase family protein [Candidatus Omnitrophota bacterium]